MDSICTTINGLWKGEKAPLVNIGVIRNANFTKEFTLDYSKIEYINVESRSFEKRYLDDGDIIVEKSGGSDNFPVGRSILYSGESRKYSFSNFTMSLRIIDKRAVLPRYLYYVLQQKYRRGDMKQMQTQTTGLHNLLSDVFLSMPIPIPPKEEQQRIIERVDALFTIVSELDVLKDDFAHSINAAKSRILDLAIHGKLVPQDPSEEPAIELLKRINPAFKPSHNLHYETQQLFSLPKGWEWCSVKDYTKKVTDYVASGSFASLKENVRYYKSPNYAILVKTKDFANNFSEDLTYTDEHGYNFLENSHLYGGELIFSNVGSVGKIFKVPKMNMRMSLAPNAIMVKFHQDEQASWFERVFQSPFGQESLRAIASATAIMKFNKTDFGKLLIPVPPVSEQKRILNAIEALFVQLNCIYDTE